MSKGKFIIIDGMDGAGKTTAAEILKNKHIDRGLPVEIVNVWKSTRYGTNTRAEIVDGSQTLNPEVATLMAIGAVLHCYHSVVQPMLDKGISVILDRGPRSSYVLQVLDQHVIGNQVPLSLWRIGFSNMVPDVEVVMVVDAETALSRCLQRDGQLDGIEARGIDYHQMTMDRYKTPIEGRKDPVVIHNYDLRALDRELKTLMDEIYS